MPATLMRNGSAPRLSRAMLASAALHMFILAGSGVYIVRVSMPLEDPLNVTWIEPVGAPRPEVDEPGGSRGPAPKSPEPVAPRPSPKPKFEPRPVPVQKKPVPRPTLNPLADKTTPVVATPLPSDALSARLNDNEYVDFSSLKTSAREAGIGSGGGRGGLLGDGVGSGVAARRPIVYLSRSMYNPKRKDLEVYDKMFWHVIDHWELPLAYRDQTSLVASINVRFDSDGNITKFKFVRKSGDPEFDDTVLDAVVSANPLPRPTKEFYQRFFDSGIDLVIEPKKIYFYSWPDPYSKKKRLFGF